ncbi:oxidoreductase [Novosphingobium flavum]|uniref:Oxidoreductase n=1 Tax=Novosphingobium flavum TaxID=1778672 RepID=A0A7X1KN34_9SPHN|nr:PDR/VanB family oxidoreductase [Novosphingobium flavum]MBC2667003.1 oxidoreductase [Novosphingobium flavum]
MALDPASAESPATASRITMVLVNIRYAAQRINLYTFELEDGGILPPSEAGGHIGLHLPNGLNRQYSLIDCGPTPTSYTVGIKHDWESRGASRWIHEQLRVGARLEIDPPRNNFPLDERAGKSIFVAGGIGITPIRSMLTRLDQLGRAWELHYSCSTSQEMAFLRELSGRSNVYLYFSGGMNGRKLDLAAVVSAAPTQAHLYCCGPVRMIEAFEEACQGASLPAEQVHVEYFAPRFETATSGGFVVELAQSGKELPVPEGKTILQVLLDAGVDVAHSCDSGICGTCETRVLEGVPDHRDSILNDEERASNKMIMVCCSGSRSPKLVLDL